MNPTPELRLHGHGKGHIATLHTTRQCCSRYDSAALDVWTRDAGASKGKSSDPCQDTSWGLEPTPTGSPIALPNLFTASPLSSAVSHEDRNNVFRILAFASFSHQDCSPLAARYRHRCWGTTQPGAFSCSHASCTSSVCTSATERLATTKTPLRTLPCNC